MKLVIGLLLVLTLIPISIWAQRELKARQSHKPELGGNVKAPELKQFGDLESSDFERHPVWASCNSFDEDEPWYDDTDEETFRPWTGALPVSPQLGMFLVRAKFETANGTKLSGFVTPAATNGLGELQPTILAGSSQFGFWHGMLGSSPDERKQLYDTLDIGAERVFPLQFYTDGTLASGVTSGRIDGFYSLDPTGAVRIER